MVHNALAMEPTRILLVDDDAAFCDQASAYLAQHGCSVLALTDPFGLPGALEAFRPQLVLLDQRLGTVSGTEVLKKLRDGGNTPCIIITGCSDPFDRIVNLELGADDEVEKSIAPRELIARIRGVLRRSGPAGEAPSGSSAQPDATQRAVSAAGRSGWHFDTGRRMLLRPDGSNCGLTTAEYETFRVLHDAMGQTVARAELSLRVFQRPWRANDRGVDTVIKKLRHKIEPDSADPQCIKTVRQIGYVFVGFPP
ncbi:response regulator [Falsiroseomonas stagni]|uniref:Two-component system, OmpR family, response regulator n=1 Tax=Falsiroseomonas stagni DSM 19981 TaxID=1123062 RepID=A0A1I4F044_9PROT|nr:response regulator transcription factor [Falsiroseomonas stagni]SFL09751.1 two-component system, OmpR family, response regulator [Falsiroseomonas stagni DSM 19981]